MTLADVPTNSDKQAHISIFDFNPKCRGRNIRSEFSSEENKATRENNRNQNKIAIKMDYS